MLKPSELTPSTAILLMRYLDEAGLPAGVGNLVLGAGPTPGPDSPTHPAVDLVSFTGGLADRPRLMANAAATVKKVALELGGKNPNIVFADADLEMALDFALTAVFLHSGQVCSAGARLLVEDVDQGRVRRRARPPRRADPPRRPVRRQGRDRAAHLAPPTATRSRRTSRAGIAEGAQLRAAARRPDDPALADGYYYLPTISTTAPPT